MLEKLGYRRVAVAIFIAIFGCSAAFFIAAGAMALQI